MYTKTSLVLVEDSEKDIKLVLSCAGKVVMQKLERNATQAGIIKAAAEEVPSLSTARGRPSRKYVLGYDGSEEQIQTPIVKDESGPSLRPRRENSTPISRTESHGLSSNQPASFFGFTSEQPCGSTGAAFSHAAKILKLSRIAQGRGKRRCRCT